ncbi:MAG: adenosylmethionine--8-amino-7-oxononanoate transaminase [Planctomycetes bacterium]|nr:adenosylmethionine--8-amino-7-oxononanoate transaminase [Planctomycetota bacterium]
MNRQERDKKHVWHPFTQMKDYLAGDPLVIAEGEGAILRDIDGNEYIDGVSSLWCNVHGHRKKEIDGAVIEQLGKVAHSTLLGLANVPSIELAEKLVEITPEGLSKVFYSDAGATAMEIALKMAFQYWRHKGQPQRTRFVSLTNAYHGDTIGAVSLGGIDLFHETFRPLLFDVLHAPSPFCYRCELRLDPKTCGMACAKKLREIVEQHRDEVVGVFLEPLVQGAAGIIVAPEGYLKEAECICRDNDTLLVCDEVATGFGRTGKMFACFHEQVKPDILACGKGITGGYLPLAATLATDEIYDAFLGDYSERKTFFHGHTYTGNALACAAALGSLRVFEKERVLDALQPKIALLERRLKEFSDLEHVGDVRQRGFMAGVELVHDRETKTPYDWDEKIGIQVVLAARRCGLILRPLGNVIVLMPPLCVTEEQLNRMLDVIHECITTVTEGE